MQSTAGRRADRNAGRSRRPHQAGAMAVLLTAVTLVAGACSGDGEPGKTVASVTAQARSTSAATRKADPLAFAKCMRENGLADFPDPEPGKGLAFKPGGSLDPDSPQFKTAENKCKRFMPGDGQQMSPPDNWSSADQLKYAACMRENGVSKFPDPDANGGFPALIKGGPVDPDSPQFKKAEAACSQYQPQNITKRGPGDGS
ncbi:hypothetical protein [Nonomuraea basaltis]|uniref:hypothetical protein n=1 Tax=Nonomuraea basaltis TaxID=2495887 RepID=UPI00110C688C|nr:hypothetical protein [Nonomuraea basaltis]TMR88794.1 hypothetical protein EJK15_64290 [Nonomuraea basaltis]